MGLLTTDIKYESLRTVFLVSTDVDFERLNRDLAAMRAGLEEQFRADGFDLGKIRFYRSADARYVGQGYELRVDIPDGPIDAAAIRRTFDQFHSVHEAEYGHFFAESPIEIVNVRLTRRGADADHPPGERQRRRQPRRGPAQESPYVLPALRAAGTDGGGVLSARTAASRASRVEGPAIILQTDSTTVVPPGWTIVADGSGNLIMKARGAA